MTYPTEENECHICRKTFVSAKGLQQHHAVHTGEKTFQCEICTQVFRFRSNLFEHMSVHSGSTPYACPYCGKACRLKGNLKKHLRTHVTTAEELEAAWRPFASRRSNPVVRRSWRGEGNDESIEGGGASFHGTTVVLQENKRQSGLGRVADWVERIRNGKVLPQMDIDSKIGRLEEMINGNGMMMSTCRDLFENAKEIPCEPFNCPMCHSEFPTKLDCSFHCEYEHPNCLEQFKHFCEKCFRPFADEDSHKQHLEYHERVQIYTQENPVKLKTMIPMEEDLDRIVEQQLKLQMGCENQPVFHY